MLQNETGTKGFTSGEALEPYRRVKLSAANTVVYADGGEASIGVTSKRAATSGDSVSVRLWTASGSWDIEALGAISAAAEVYGADSGKVQTAASGTGIGWANEAAAQSGDVIEIISMQSAEA